MTLEQVDQTELKREILRNYFKKRNPIHFFEPISHPGLNQKEFIESPKRNKTALGGNRSGKTESGAYIAIHDCLTFPNRDWWAATWADMSTPIQQKKYYVSHLII